MKKRNLFLTLGLSLTLGVGVAGGLAMSKLEVNEVEATTTYRAQDGFKTGDTIYVQPKSSWTDANAKFAIAFLDTGDAHTTWSPFLTNVSRDGIYYWTIDDRFNYVAVKVILVRYGPSKASPDWSDLWGQTKDLVVGSDNFNKNNNCIYLPNSVSQGGGFFAYNESDYQLTVGSKTEYLTRASIDEGEFSVTMEVSAGDSISLTVDGAPQTLTPNSNHANNANSDLKVKVGGNHGFYVRVEAGHTLWVTGYDNCGSDVLQNFCNSILSNTISGSTCNVGHWDWVQGAWNYVLEQDNSAELVARFNAGVINWGAEYNHTNVINEARTRYAYLHEKFDVTLTNATLPSSARVVPTNSVNNTIDSSIIVAFVVIGLIATAGAFFVIRRRKEQE